jgi:hypothetical protein
MDTQQNLILLSELASSGPVVVNVNVMRMCCKLHGHSF